MKTLHKYYEAGYIPKDVATSDTGYDLLKIHGWFCEETVGPADYGNSLLTRVANRKIDIKPFTELYKKNNTTQVANFVISNNSKNKEKAMEVLNLLNTDPELFERPCLWTRRQELGKSSWQRKPCQSLGWLQRKHSHVWMEHW